MFSFSLSSDTGEEVKRAEIMSRLLFDSDYEGLDATHVIERFQGDPRLVVVERSEILSAPVTKLASKYGLVASTSKCPVVLVAFHSNLLFRCRPRSCQIPGFVPQ